MTRKSPRPWLAWFSLALVVALVVAATWKLTLGGRIIARGDLLLYFYPLRDFASAAIREARLPLWNPFAFMGAPFLANSQVGFFYPPNVVAAWLPVEVAVNLNIVAHLAIAGVGMFGLARAGMKLGALASFAAAVAFSLGGYLGAQVEHLNQVQALAWLPLEMLLVIGDWGTGGAKARVRNGVARLVGLAALLALQATAGHTQSLYISVVTLGLVALAQAAILWRAERRAVVLAPLLVVAAAGALAALMASAQLLPTLELARESARSGGLPFNESASFSWRPWVIARALLPTFGDPLFAEYVAYFGAAALALATLGATFALPSSITDRAPTSAARHTIALPIVLVAAGLVLALGVATPLFGALHRFMPGFALFRAQARWLVVFALGVSLLIGFGAQTLRDGLPRRHWRVWALAFGALNVLLLLGLAIGARLSPEPEYAGLPANSVVLGWAVAFGLTWLLIVACRLLSDARENQTTTSGQRFSLVFVALMTVELFVASQFQPYARASDPQALTSLRPATAHLLSERERGRVLTLSSLFFDPGDLPEQTLLYQSQLSPDELYDRVIASKHKEILSPNLSLYYRLQSVDGYDGGLLPTRNYANFVANFAPRDKPATSDGRLRETLKGVPADEWLRRMAVRYVVADKTGDIFADDVYYDLQFSAAVSSVVALTLAPYASTALGVVLDADALLSATLTFTSGRQATFNLSPSALPNAPHSLARVQFGARETPTRIEFRSARPARIWGVSNIDASDDTFLSQVVNAEDPSATRMKLVHSGDVKVYENLRPAPRASVVSGDDIVAARITRDDPEHVAIELPNRQAAGDSNAKLLILRDACYAGWVARVDGVVAPIQCADGLFRSVSLPAGARSVTFDFEPQSVQLGLILSVLGISVWLGLLVFALTTRRAWAARTN